MATGLESGVGGKKKAIYSKQHTQVTASVRGSQLRFLWHSRIDNFPAQDVFVPVELKPAVEHYTLNTRDP